MSAPALARTSPVEGLRRRRLSFVQVLAQSVAALAPTAALVTVPALVMTAGGSATLPAVVAATALVLLVAWSLGHAGRRMAAVGGVYSYCARGLGPVPGVLCGWALVIGYAALTMSALVGAAVYGTRLLVPHLPEGASRVLVPLGVVVLGGVVALVVLRGVQLSARLVLGLEAFAVALVLTVLGVMVSRSPSTPAVVGGTGASVVDATPDVGGMALAVVLAVTAFVGFESASVLGVESRRPLVYVPRAVLWTPAVGGLVFLVGTWVQLALLRQAPVDVVLSDAPLDELVRRAALLPGGPGGVLTSLMDAAITAAFLACATGALTALSRILFSMGREGVLPSRLGTTSRRTGTPTGALAVAVPVVLAVPTVVLLSGAAPRTTLSSCVTVAAFGCLLAYVLASAAAPALLHRIGELTPMALIGGVVASLACAGVLVAAVVAGPWAGAQSLALVTAAAMVPGAARVVWLRLRDPEALARAGIYDEPTLRSVLRGSTSPR